MKTKVVNEPKEVSLLMVDAGAYFRFKESEDIYLKLENPSWKENEHPYTKITNADGVVIHGCDAYDKRVILMKVRDDVVFVDAA